jgi:DNA-binding transcriptional LysR family regulator
VGLERALAALEEQRAQSGRASLNVTAAPSVAAKWLAPRLHRLQAEYPWLEVRLDASDRRVDLARDPGSDVALRYGAGPYDPGLRAIRLWPPGNVIAVCAPPLIAEGTLRRPEDILEHGLLRTVHPGLPDQARGGAGPLSWESWFAAAGIHARPVNGPLFGSTHLALEAALAGRGFALAPMVLVEEDIRRGRLVQPFPIALPDPFSYWLLFRADRAEERGIRAFARWIGKEAGTDAATLTARAGE